MPFVPNVRLPVLTLPKDSRGSATGTLPEREGLVVSHAFIETRSTPGTLLEHFAGQLTTQSWRRVASWSQDGLHGSAWLAPDTSASGLLTVVDTGENRYRLVFEVAGAR